MITTPMIAGVEEILEEFSVLRTAITERLAAFASVQPADYFFEMVYCLLTPQSSAVHAGAALEKLRLVFPWEDRLSVACILAERESYIRFHNTKAGHLILAQKTFTEVLAQLTNGPDSSHLRRWLALHVKGMGWKEASHFLRNIGHRNLAILDRHILKNLVRHGVIERVPRSLTPARYCAIEEGFLRFAASIGLSVDELDLLFWSRETGEILK